MFLISRVVVEFHSSLTYLGFKVSNGLRDYVRGPAGPNRSEIFKILVVQSLVRSGP